MPLREAHDADTILPGGEHEGGTAAHGAEDDESLRAPSGPAVHGRSAEQLAALRARRDRALAPAARIGATEVRW